MPVVVNCTLVKLDGFFLVGPFPGQKGWSLCFFPGSSGYIMSLIEDQNPVMSYRATPGLEKKMYDADV